MEILQLRYFFESSQNENFAKTAEKHMVPTSSVSASIKRLETELGCKLFNRTHNKITLNENGKRLKQAVAVAFSELDQAVHELSDTKTDEREIKMLVRAMRSNITDYIIEFKEKHPKISFKTVFDFYEKNFEEYDIIIDEKKDTYTDYESFELYSMRLRMMVSSSSPLCDRHLCLKQLENQPFISLGESSNMHKILVKSCMKSGFSPNISVHSNDIKCFEKLIESGIGIGIGREILSNITSKKISYLDISDFNERYTVCSYYRQESAYGNVKDFLDFLKNKAI